MTDKQIQERLLLAALTDDVPTRASRATKSPWRYAAAAVVAVLLTLPFVLHPSAQPTEPCSEEEAASELLMALNEVNLHLNLDENDLLNF